MTSRAQARHPTEDPLWAKLVVIGLVLLFLGLVLVLPLVAVFAEALRKGLQPALDAIADADALAAIKLSLFTAAIAVPFNAVFGLCACLLYTSPSPRDRTRSRMPSSA